MKTAQIEVRRSTGWETVRFEEVEQISVAAAPGEDGLYLTLIGHREDQPNQVETDVLDIAERHDVLVDSEFPRTEIGVSLPCAQRENCNCRPPKSG